MYYTRENSPFHGCFGERTWRMHTFYILRYTYTHTYIHIQSGSQSNWSIQKPDQQLSSHLRLSVSALFGLIAENPFSLPPSPCFLSLSLPLHTPLHKLSHSFSSLFSKCLCTHTHGNSYGANHTASSSYDTSHTVQFHLLSLTSAAASFTIMFLLLL